MSRIIFPIGEQSLWIKKLLDKNDLTVKMAANLCRVSQRTFRDWRCGRYSISEEAFIKLSNGFGLPLPKNIQKVSDYWYAAKGARKGGLKRFELYGALGTEEGRKKGGRVSQQRRRENPKNISY